MAFCKNCGKELGEGVRFCPECGAEYIDQPAPQPVMAAAVSQPQPQQPLQYQQTQPAQQPQQPQSAQSAAPAEEGAPQKGSRFEPITTGGYVGILLLLCIPAVGLVIAIVWACGGCKKINKRNLCRAYLIFMAISIVIGVAITLISGGIAKAVAGAGYAASATEQGEEKSALEKLLGGVFGSDESAAGSVLGGLVGGESEATDSGKTVSEFQSEAEQAREDASKNGEGWPYDMPVYPYGTSEETETYRTIVTGSSKEEMFSYVDTLKAKGFYFTDIYNFGFTEADMNSMDAWWGTNGRIYVSLSYYEGSITIDYLDEVPDLDSYFN